MPRFIVSRQLTYLVVGVLVVALSTPPTAWGWGGEGHIIVAKIAELRLTPQAKTAINEILGDRSIAEGRLSSWADLIKHSSAFTTKYPKNPSWHFVNIPIEETDFKSSRDCKQHNCIVDRITQFQETMADGNASPTDRKEALLFVVHFLGDIHQPLHCADRAGDRGGNKLTVTFRGQGDPHMNLHSVWDTTLVHEVMDGLQPEDTAHRLNSDISAELQAEWEGGTPKDWAVESHGLAIKNAYRDADGNELPQDGEPDLGDDYIGPNAKVVRIQLARGGVRLAKVLNDAFGK